MHRRAAWASVAAFLTLLPLASAPAAGASVDVIVLGTDTAAARAAVRGAGGRVSFELPIVNGVAASVPSMALGSLEAADGVRSVTEDEPVRVNALLGAAPEPSPSSTGEQTPSPLHAPSAIYPQVVGAHKLWRDGLRGQGVSVAVIDTGISRVPDLGTRVIAGVDFTPEGDPFRDSFGHGTFIAGMIAGDGTSSKGAVTGVAPGANLVSVKIADASGASDVSHVLAALQWVVSFKDTYGIGVVNLSLGTDSSQPYRLSPLNFAVERAWDAGLVVVVSSSNAGPAPGTVAKPGDDPLVITVGAIDDLTTARRNDDMMAGFSGAGPTSADGLTKPDLVAPGRSVISLRAPDSTIDAAYPSSRVGSAYFKGSGTSFSTAVTSGSVALLLQRDPWLSPNQVKHRLLSTAAPGPVRQPNVDGAGSLDAYAASRSLSLAQANVGVQRSLGLGTIGADRGSLTVEIDTGDPVLTLLDGALTAQNLVFDAPAYLTDPWSATSWAGSQWAGTRWYGTRWYGTRWYGTRWYSTEWYGTRWYGTAWE